MHRLHFRVLGPVEVTRDGRPIALGNGVLLSALTGLLISTGQIVSAETLVELVWGGNMPERPRAALHSAISRLRRLIDDGSLETIAGAYRLKSDADHLDLLRFDKLLAECAKAEAAGALSVAVASAEEAFGLWHDPLLGNLDVSVFDRVAARLNERYIAANERWAELCLRLGRPAPVTDRLPRLVRDHPFRERMIGQLMIAFLRTGRQSDALACYETLRSDLADELGIEPSRALQDLHLGILRADPDLMGYQQVHIGMQTSAEAVAPRQLPPDVTDFTGRQEEVSEVTRSLGSDAAPTVVITGPGGVGKTALAIYCAHRLLPEFSDGQLYVDLCGSGSEPADPAIVLAGFLRALGMTIRTIPEGREERLALYRSLLAERSVLVVLDNAASERQIRPLLPGGPKCAVVVTSRYRLTGIPGVQLIDLDVFDDHHAMDFLGRLVGGRRLTAESQHANTIIRQCGGLPLALRIAGAKLSAHPHWRVAILAERLANIHNRLNELTHGDLDLRATVALSYDGFTIEEKMLLRRLSLLDTPDFSTWIGAALLGTDLGRADEILDVLVNARLLDICVDRNSGPLRYRFHDLVRVYAQERAAEEESRADHISALARAFACQLTLVEYAHRMAHGGDHSVVPGGADRWRPDGEWLDRLIADEPVVWMDSERSTILAVIRQSAELGMHELCWDMAWISDTLFEDRGYGDEWRNTHEEALTAVRKAGNRRGEAAVMLSLAGSLLYQHRLDDASAFCETAARLFADVGDEYGHALAQARLAYIDRANGRLESAISRFKQSLRMFEGVGDRFGEVFALRGLAYVHLGRKEYEQARPLVDKGLVIAEAMGSRRPEALMLHIIAELHLCAHEYESAECVIQRALHLVQGDSDQIGEIYALIVLGEAQSAQGRRDTAEPSLRKALDGARRYGQRNLEARALSGLGGLS